MFSCDYNGWSDVPEEEREGIEAFESAQSLPVSQVYVPVVIERPLTPLHAVLERRAA